MSVNARYVPPGQPVYGRGRRTELGHEIPPQKARAPKHRYRAAGHRAPSGGSLLDGGLAGGEDGHIMESSLCPRQHGLESQ